MARFWRWVTDARRVRAGVGLGLSLAMMSVLAAACSTAGTPSVAQPPATVTSTVLQTTTVQTSVSVTATTTVTPVSLQSSVVPGTLVVPTFADPAEFTCSDPSAVSCWQISAVTTGPCPNGVYVAISVTKPNDPAVVTTLDAVSVPVTDALGGTVDVQLSLLDTAYVGQDLLADVAQARCA